MSPVFLVIGAVLIGLAGLIHIYIFYMESITWGSPGTWRRFGIGSQEEADTVKPMAYNQGFYNGFLAIGALAGIILAASAGFHQAGVALEFMAAGSMTLAATVLIISSPKLARAAVLQGLLPLLGIIFTIIGVVAA